MAMAAATRVRVHSSNRAGDDAMASSPVPARLAMATVAAAAHVDDGNRAGNDAAASTPVPYFARAIGTVAVADTARVMMPRHHHLSLASLCDGKGGGSSCVDAHAHQRRPQGG